MSLHTHTFLGFCEDEINNFSGGDKEKYQPPILALNDPLFPGFPISLRSLGKRAVSASSISLCVCRLKKTQPSNLFHQPSNLWIGTFGKQTKYLWKHQLLYNSTYP